MLEITPIQLSMPFRLGSVNCYLLNTDNGFFLIDTSSSNNRDELERVLQRAGCEPGQLKMIILTHGDFDHSGNAAYLRKKFDAKTAMHKDDLGMVKDGNMFSSRQKGNNIPPRLIERAVFPCFHTERKSISMPAKRRKSAIASEEMNCRPVCTGPTVGNKV